MAVVSKTTDSAIEFMQGPWSRHQRALMRSLRRVHVALLAMALNISVPVSTVYADGVLPTGGHVVAGQAGISGDAQSLTISQSSNKAIINWNGFSISDGNSVQFNNGSGATLNRVTGGNVSSIDGLLSATGSVYLINPNGVIIGEDGVVRVGGSFAASTLDLANADFLRGGDMTFGGASNAAIVNLGKIGALGGDVALMASTVVNDGSIDAPNGTGGLLAGHSVLMRDASVDDGKFLVLSGGADTSATNAGAISAAAAELRAQGGNVYALAGNTKGVISATSVTTKDGKVYLTAGEGGAVIVSGSLISAHDKAGNGGAISVSGQKIDVASDATLDTSATAPAGAGGEIKVIADMASGTLSFHGHANARGGDAGGNGGFVETSGHDVDFTGAHIDTSALRGSDTGDWLVDPYDLTVDSAAATTINTNLGSTNVKLQTTATGTSGTGTANANGNGDIFVNSALTWASTNTLTLDAYRNININAAITASGGGKVVLVTGDQAATGKSSSATGDYNFGLSSSGFAGSISFTGGSASGSTLNIGTGGDNIAPSSYTLIYALPAATTGAAAPTGNRALATNITDNVSRTSSVYTGTFSGKYTGLGHTVSGLTLDPSASNAGFFETITGTVRDLGLSGSLIETNNSIGNFGLLAGTLSAGTVKNVYTSGVVTDITFSTGNLGGFVGTMQSGATIDSSWSSAAVNNNAGNTGGLVGILTNGSVTAGVTAGTISNSYATGNVTAQSFNAGGLIGTVGPSNPTVAKISNSYATGNVTSGTRGQAGGLIGFMNQASSSNHSIISNAYAAGTVDGGSDGSNGGLIGGVSAYTDIINSHATGAVTSTGAGTGGLIGTTDGTATVTITGSYATGNVTNTTASGTSIGGLVGDFTGTLNTSFSTGDVSAYQYAGGLIGATRGGSVLNDVYETGSISVTTGQIAGGLIGYVGGATTITNAYSAGTTPAGSTSNYIGAVIGYNASAATMTNVYWDSVKEGSIAYGQGTGTATSRTTTQLQNGTLPTGFNSGTPNGTPWHAGNGLYPYF